ncbi:MAG: hypothetical protein JXA95_12345 [Spirochaetales bacterium]|nr:hypothetical protein [Spirochaetales bacterium]
MDGNQERLKEGRGMPPDFYLYLPSCVIQHFYGFIMVVFDFKLEVLSQIPEVQFPEVIDYSGGMIG